MTLLAKYDELVQQSLDRPGEDIRDAVISLITKTHFLLLKVNFEFFLNRMAHCVWDAHFEHLVHAKKLPSEKAKLEEFAAAVSDGTAKEFILSRVIPTNGLYGWKPSSNSGPPPGNILVENGPTPSASPVSWYTSLVSSCKEVQDGQGGRVRTHPPGTRR